MTADFAPVGAQRRLDRWTAIGAAIDASRIVAEVTGAKDPLDVELRNAIDGLVRAQVVLAKLQLKRALPTAGPQ